MPPEFDVFLSYSSHDKAIADAVVSAVEAQGIRCWYAPRDIEPGADWAESITRAIQVCSMMVLVFSETANRSQRVIDEINYAIDQGKPILPFRIEPHNPTGALGLHLSSRHWLDAFDPSWEVHLDRLVDSVVANLGTQGDQIEISGGAASASVSGERKERSLKMPVYLAAGLAVVSILGYLGWRMLAVQPAPEPTETNARATDIPAANESQAAEESLPEPTPTPDFSAVLSLPLIDYEGITSLDPHLADGAALVVTKNLFLGLTRFNSESAEVEPAAASSWSVSPDGTIYTFTLHPDIPWVQHALGGETLQVQDEEGNPRFLTAEDFEYAFKRICDPREAINYREILSNVVGCREALEYQDPENIPPELIDAIGVEAVSDTELIIKLIEPSASFLTKTIHPTLYAVPSWAIEKYGEAWTNPGLIPSYGLFVIDQWIPGENINLVRNQLLPAAVQGEGNLGTVDMTVVSNGDEAYQLWLDGKVDYSEVPQEMQESHRENYPDQTLAFNNQVAFYAVFNHDNQVFNNLHLRRAFSASLDRISLLDEVIKVGGIPMIHLAPPGVFGALPVDQVGIGYDSEFALSELEHAGYPDCEGIPNINFYAYSGIASTFGEEISRFWEDSLGCPEGTINYRGWLIEIFESGDPWDDWDLIITGWGSDFPDQDNWVGTLLSCEADDPLRSNRECSEVDELITQARIETSPSARRELYREIEESFFGEDGSFPIAPIFTLYQYFAAREWVSLAQPVTFEGFDLARTHLDMDAKLSELGE